MSLHSQFFVVAGQPQVIVIQLVVLRFYLSTHPHTNTPMHTRPHTHTHILFYIHIYSISNMLHDNLSISPEKTASRPSEVKSTSLEKLPLILFCAHTASQNRLKFYLQVLSTTKFIFKCSLSPSWQIVSFLFFGPHMRMEQTGKKPACRLVYPPVSTL